MAVNFPSSPTVDDEYAIGNKTYVWNGYAWDLKAVAAFDPTALQAEVDVNTAKVSDVVHPLVETAVPAGAVFTDTVYVHPSVNHIPSGGSSGQILGYSANGLAQWIAAPSGTTDLDKTRTATTVTITSSSGNDVILYDATNSLAGVMSSAHKIKLDGIADNANEYTHPTGDGNSHVPINGTSSAGKVLTAGATAGVYTWEVASTVTQAEIDALSVDAETVTGFTVGTSVPVGALFTDTVYAHPTVNHIPTGGASGQILGYSSAGVAQWVAAPSGVTDLGKTRTATTMTITSSTGADVILGDPTNSLAGIMSSAQKVKLDGIADSANAYVHPTGAGSNHIPTGGTVGQLLVNDAAGVAVWGSAPASGASETQTINTTTVFVDASTGLNYKMYIDNARILIEEL